MENTKKNKMTSKERLLKTLNHEPTDRVPVMPFDAFEIRQIQNSTKDLMFASGRKLSEFTNGWKKTDPRYKELLDFVTEKGCDIIHRTSFTELDRRFMLIPTENISIDQINIDEDTIRRKYSIRTPKGVLTYVDELKKDISTTWIVKTIVETLDDIDKLLSVPFIFKESDLTGFKTEQQLLGESGLMCCFVSSPMVCVSHLFEFEKFLMLVIEKPAFIEKLVNTVFERIYTQLEYLLQQGVGPLIEFGGSEQATPPMMSPHLFDNLVVKYDHQLIKLVHRYGGKVRIHCHGKVKTVLKKFQDMGMDMINPIEAPPSGDINLDEAQLLVNRRMVLEGNIQYSTLEMGSTEEVIDEVKDAIEKGGTDNYILEPTEWPLSFLTEQQKSNYMHFIQTALNSNNN